MIPAIFCCICRESVPPERVVRGAVTCTKQHAALKKKQMREYRASKNCPMCGRRARKAKVKSAVSLVGPQGSVSTVPGADVMAPTIPEQCFAEVKALQKAVEVIGGS